MFIPQPYLNCFVCSLLHNPLRMPSVLCSAWKKTEYEGVWVHRCVSVCVCVVCVLLLTLESFEGAL